MVTWRTAYSRKMTPPDPIYSNQQNQSTMPPKGNHITFTPEEFAELQAKRILNEHGYVHSGQVIDYDEAVEILRDVIIKNQK